MINYLALIIALSVSFVSAYYSIIGLATIFAAAYWPVVSMGIVLELGKLVTASWLYNNWKIASSWLKIYLTCAVIILCLISSMGIFGFLSKAHIQQTLTFNTGNIDKIKIIDSKIDNEQQSIKDIDIQINQIDNALNKMIDKGRANDSLKAGEQQRNNRNILVNKKDVHLQKIAELSQEKIILESKTKEIEAEVGPLKYLADMIYDETDKNKLEKAVRYVIITLMFVFDPLAIILLIAANNGIAYQASRPGRPKGKKLNSNYKIIPKHNITMIGDDHEFKR